MVKRGEGYGAAVFMRVIGCQRTAQYKEIDVGNMMLRLCLLTLFLSACTNMAPERPKGPAGSERMRDVDGEAVAIELNHRYEDVRTTCEEGSAAYFCTGVMYRAVTWSADYYFFNNQHGTHDISFSYVRKDVGLRGAYRGQGFILKAADAWGKNGYLSLHMTCSYAFNAVSAARSDRGCGRSGTTEKTEPCAEQGITTLDAYIALLSAPVGNADKLSKQCSMGTDAKAFEMSVQGRRGGFILNPEEFPQWFWTEQIISDWPDNAAKELPVEALFVVDDEKDLDDRLRQARAMQQDYASAAGRWVPILRFDTANLSTAPFRYVAGDQRGTAYTRPARYAMKGPGTPASYTGTP